MMFDKILNIMLWLVGASMILLLALVVFAAHQVFTSHEIQAKEMNCEYLGIARDLGSVAFYDCAGTITLRRSK